jgi:hypothetical protein
MNRLVASARFVFVLIGLLAFAQGRESFKAQLSALPADAKTRPNLAGSGLVRAALDGTKLSIDGSFEGLKTKATTASLHDGIATGVRGPSIYDLTVTSGMSGAITGSFNLTPEQVEHLKKGRLYIQLHTENASDGALWGWFLH